MKIRRIEFTLPAIPPSLNVMLRTHWVKREKEQKKWNYLVLCVWLARDHFRFIKPVSILYTITFRTKRIRDLDNYIGGTKYITDALKRTFLTQDDAGWLKRITVEFKTGNPQTAVSISEVLR